MRTPPIATSPASRNGWRRRRSGRLGRPEDPARLIGWLCTDAGAWITGQVLTSDGGFGLR
ncbi:SDR family oxidoreductase [Microbacterium resistens]|uniref:SDR family oxidoreductase n=1 Tax=Microbacterium resistens TaxID=156977 RepID=UPI00300F80D2